MSLGCFPREESWISTARGEGDLNLKTTEANGFKKGIEIKTGFRKMYMKC
jgi:hypothetical protein